MRTSKEIDELLGINDPNVTRGIVQYLVRCGALTDKGAAPRTNNKGRGATLYEVAPDAKAKVLATLAPLLDK